MYKHSFFSGLTYVTRTSVFFVLFNNLILCGMSLLSPLSKEEEIRHAVLFGDYELLANTMDKVDFLDKKFEQELLQLAYEGLDDCCNDTSSFEDEDKELEKIQWHEALLPFKKTTMLLLQSNCDSRQLVTVKVSDSKKEGIPFRKALPRLLNSNISTTIPGEFFMKDGEFVQLLYAQDAPSLINQCRYIIKKRKINSSAMPQNILHDPLVEPEPTTCIVQ